MSTSLGTPYLEGVLVGVETVCVLLLGDDQPLVQEEDVSTTTCPAVTLVDCKIILHVHC